MKKTSVLCGLVALLVLGGSTLAGCAGYKVKPIDPAAIDSAWSTQDEGYIVYEPAPYLRVVVTTSVDGKREVSAEIVYLPNKKHPYRVTTYAYLASANIKLAYKDGWMLTGAESNVDTSQIAKTVLDAVKDAAGGVRVASKSGQKTQSVDLQPGIYLFRIDDVGLILTHELNGIPK